ncbi:MAG TPA: hypothetical protein VMU33_10560 [Burkholderiaceae bacterium]|nr:hypothetical protein [Burkholderiaceae bacterium]
MRAAIAAADIIAQSARRAAVAIAPLAIAFDAGAAGGDARLERLAPGVYVQRGAVEAASAANRGRIANRGILVGRFGVVMVNTGASTQDAEALIAATARLTPLPIVAAIDTQATPDAVLGNGALAARGIPVIAHRETDAFMVRNCAACIGATIERTGDSALRAIRPSRPSWLVDTSRRLELGGRTVDLLYFGWTEQPGAIAVLDVASGVLFSGGLADFDVVPDIRAARTAAWRAALGRLEAIHPSLVVPAHGPPAAPARLGEVDRYLAALESETLAAYRDGIDLQQAESSVQVESFAGWLGYRERQPSNVHFAYLEIERRELQVLRRDEEGGGQPGSE